MKQFYLEEPTNFYLDNETISQNETSQQNPDSSFELVLGQDKRISLKEFEDLHLEKQELTNKLQILSQDYHSLSTNYFQLQKKYHHLNKEFNKSEQYKVVLKEELDSIELKYDKFKLQNQILEKKTAQFGILETTNLQNEVELSKLSLMKKHSEAKIQKLKNSLKNSKKFNKKLLYKLKEAGNNKSSIDKINWLKESNDKLKKALESAADIDQNIFPNIAENSNIYIDIVKELIDSNALLKKDLMFYIKSFNKFDKNNCRDKDNSNFESDLNVKSKIEKDIKAYKYIFTTPIPQSSTFENKKGDDHKRHRSTSFLGELMKLKIEHKSYANSPLMNSLASDSSVCNSDTEDSPIPPDLCSKYMNSFLEQDFGSEPQNQV